MIDRLLPVPFQEEWQRTVGPIPEDFKETYELLCEALYWGVRSRESAPGGPRGKGYRPGYWFGDDSLLEVKSRADRYLSQTAKALRRWRGQGEGTRTQGPQEARGVDLSGARVQGHRSGARREEA